ncbi:InlB B-repeat-containing protein [uncultured Anaerococcus sp.]|uniref:InlB B-repeat-containing protein n=1 Tax=uncultured Anaerococcus sp. TaxID=293428 RepID=UPI002889DBFF|nr:InlB B-repeat-containing protein [uncultured Anaerococcus sp.]
MKSTKKFVAFLTAAVMMASNIAPAFASTAKYDSLPSVIVNQKTPVSPAKTKKNENAADLIKNPDQPAIFTLRTDYKVQKGEKYEIDYQPYVASVGEAATKGEKEKVNQEITLPDLAGYDKSHLDDTYKIDYNTVYDAAKGKNETGDDKDGKRYFANQEFRYKAKSNEIKIKHLFQDMNDFTKYTNPGGEGKPEKITIQAGNTGSTMEVSPLNEVDRKGFEPESKFITMRVPEDVTDFVLEYRYNRAHYNVDFDTMGGTPLSTRTYYYDQEIPKIENEHIPTKVGCVFQGWMPSHDLTDKDGNTYKEGQVINKADGKPSLDLDVHLKIPALLLGQDEKSRERLKFTAVWKDKEKADYAVQFWTEKADHADNASIMEKYEYLSTRVYKDADTGLKPILKDEPVNGLRFPDLDQARLNKIWANARFNRGLNLYLNKFFVYNEDLTNKQNSDPKVPSEVKKVEATGKTVYNIYYDRQVYDLYFTKSNAQPEENTIYPEIWKYDEKEGEAVKVGGPGNPYHYKARFNEMMYKWPNDAKQTKGFTPGYQSFGWGPNYVIPNWPLHLDTPPYRLNADEFLDMANYTNWGGYTKHIDKGDGTTIDLDSSDFKTLSFGIKQDHPSIPHHMDFWMDGFKDGETIIRYDLVRTKADTAAPDYGHRYPKVTGFTPRDYEPGNPQSAWPVIRERSEENGRVDEEGINDLNDERDEITPNNCGTYYNNQGVKLPIGQLDFISVFFSDADPWGDPKDDSIKAFEENGYLRFKYTRNKYPLRFNYDPSIIRDDSYFNSKNSLDTFYEFPLKVLSPELVSDQTPREEREYFKEDPKNLLDNPENLQKLGLTDLVFTDPKDGKLKVKRPEGLSDQMVFKGWALDPAGTKLVWENKDEKMPFHPLNLYAKWGEPDYKWKVTFDPDGGKLKTIKEENLTEKRKTIQEGDIGQEEVNTYAKKEPNEGDKQVFTVIQRQKLVKPVPPVKKGYDFLGWEVIRYKKNDKGDYTDEVDTSYRDKYGVPELYTFGNDVVSPITLKAIWVPNQRVDVEVHHHILDKNCKEKEEKIDILENKRTGYYTATVGDKQGETLILASHEELMNTQDAGIKEMYEKYNKDFGFNNTYFQNQRIEPEKIKDPNSGDMIPNPAYKGNVFHFFYRPFRQREYTVNYLDEQGKAEVEKFFDDLKRTPTDGLTGNDLLEANKANKNKYEANKSKLQEIIKKHQIVEPEAVTNGNRHYDARNYRRIDGWKLTSDPQQQLFFDVNEKTNEFLGINGTGSDQIFFYYKDVRVIEVPKNGKTPDGYVRVTFKAEKGGSFGKDENGNDITELHYDVIKGLKSDFLPVPKELEEGKTKEADKYYITPDDGKKFTKWDKSPLLNKNTIINEGHEFTAYFDWSGLTAKGLIRTEAFKDDKADGTKDWSNKFAPTIDQLKAQLVWREKDQVKDLPAGTEIKLFDEAGNELTTNDQVYDLVNEKKAADKDQLVRTVNIKAKVTFKDGKGQQELDIPITVYKNVYEALTTGEKPLFLSDAEKGELKDITGNYVRVRVNPTGKPGEKDTKIYYVNPKAWVEIPEIKLTEEEKKNLGFTNWTADKANQNEGQAENGIYDFNKRHKFTEDTLIQPGFAKDVVPQEGKDKPKVPDSYVKVIVRTTDKANQEKEEAFWVNPTKEVSIQFDPPTGKEKVKVNIKGLGEKEVTYVFKGWQKVKAGEADDKLQDVKPAQDIILANNKYTDKVTVIEAAYNERFAATPIVKPIKTEELHTPEGKEITDKDLIGKITPPENKEIDSITVVERPDPSKPGKQEAKVTIKYKDGSTQGTNDNPVIIPVEIHKNIIPEAPGGQRPKDAMENYVKVIFKAGKGGSLSGDTVYYVSPEVQVDMTESAGKVTKTPDTGYFVNGEKWTNTANKTLKGIFTDPETEFVFNFDKSEDIVEKTDDPTQVIPKGYVKVTFRTEDENKGKLEGDIKEKIYYVNPKAGITLKVLGENETVKDKQLAVPKTVPATNYEFLNWQENIDENTPIKSDREHVAIFKSGQVTLTYEGGEGASGTVPASVTVNYGETVGLAGPGSLAKPNATFAGWKLDEDEKIYQPGDQVKLEKARTATAQWSSAKHTVTFNTMGGSDVPSQTVDHGNKATNPEAPKQDGKVFMGWKEKETDTSYFNFDTPITADKTLIAIWQAPVQVIDENATVEEQFIKVTFLKGKHGELDGQTTYKVAKDYTFAQAVKAGLTVPEINPAKYYKAKAENSGWDKALVLNGEDITFTAQYEPKADVIPVDPEETDKDKIKDETPEGMVLVEFRVPENKAFMTGDSKFYVKANTDVEIDTPIVHKLTLENNAVNDYEFKSWDLTKGENDKWTFENGKWKFEEDTIIGEADEVKPDIKIKELKLNANNILIDELTEGATGYLEISGEGISSNKTITSAKRGRLNVFFVKKSIGRGLKRGDKITIYAIKDGIKSEERKYDIGW